MYVNWIDKNNNKHSVKCSNKIMAEILYNDIDDFRIKEISSTKGVILGFNSKYMLLAV